MSAIVSRINGCNCACLRVAIFIFFFFILFFFFEKDKKKKRTKERKPTRVFGSGGQDETLEGIVMPTWRGIEVVGGGEKQRQREARKKERATDHQTEGGSPGDCQ